MFLTEAMTLMDTENQSKKSIYSLHIYSFKSGTTLHSYLGVCFFYYCGVISNKSLDPTGGSDRVFGRRKMELLIGKVPSRVPWGTPPPEPVLSQAGHSSKFRGQ